MNLLWRKGYQASSLPDLLDKMKIGLGSFYAAFGDKRRLYLECLKLFTKRTGAFFPALSQCIYEFDAALGNGQETVERTGPWCNGLISLDLFQKSRIDRYIFGNVI